MNYGSRRHARGADRADGDLTGQRRGLHHLAVAEVDGDVLGALGTVEDQVAALGLGRRDVAAGVVLVSGVLGIWTPTPAKANRVNPEQS